MPFHLNSYVISYFSPFPSQFLNSFIDFIGMSLSKNNTLAIVAQNSYIYILRVYNIYLSFVKI